MKHALHHYRSYTYDIWDYRHVRARDHDKAWFVRSWRYPFGRWISKDARWERVEFVD